RWSGQVGRRFGSLQALAKAAEIHPDLELRNEAVACLALADLRPLDTKFPSEGSLRPSFDAGLERYAFSNDQGDISIRRTSDHSEVLRLPGPGSRAWIVLFSPDGRYLAAKYHAANRLFPNRLLIWELTSAKSIANPPSDDAAAMLFSPDGGWVAVIRRQGSVILCDLASPTVESKTLAERVFAHGLAFHPDGTKLALSTHGPGQVQIRDVETGKILRTVAQPAARALAWHPEGKLLAAGCFAPHC